jgi:hypothetical protein
LLTLPAILTFALETGSIAGRVADAEGRPVESATVLIVASGLTATTDGDGMFLLSNVPSGVHRMEVTGEGF